MGKFIDKLERMQKAEGPRLGFGARSAAKGATLALVAVLPEADPKLAAAAMEGGADCLLVRKAGKHGAKGSLAQVLRVTESVPCGAEVAGSAEADGAGWDFAVLEVGDALGSLLQKADMDKLLLLDADPPESLLRTLDGLPIDAVVLPEPPSLLSLRGLLPYYRVARATSKPVLALLPVGEEAPLQALRDAGVSGVLGKVESPAQARALAELRKAIDQLPTKRARPSRVRATPTLGLAGIGRADEPEQQEDEGDEDDEHE